MDRDLSGLCPEHFADDADHIAHIQLLEFLIILFSDTVPCHIGLDISFQILHVAEGRLSHDTLGHHTSRDGYLAAFQLIIVVLDLLAVMCLVIFCDHKRVFPVLLQFRKFLAAHLSQLVYIRFLSIFLLLSHFLFLLPL